MGQAASLDTEKGYTEGEMQEKRRGEDKEEGKIGETMVGGR